MEHGEPERDFSAQGQEFRVYVAGGETERAELTVSEIVGGPMCVSFVAAYEQISERGVLG